MNNEPTESNENNLLNEVVKICKQKFEVMDVSESTALFDSKLKKFLTE